MSKIFSQIQSTKPPSNGFDLSHDRKFSTKFGQITPIMVLDTVPGDRIKISSSQMLRFAPMIAPIMHAVNVYTHFFFVPNRIVWPNWEEFITGGETIQTPRVFPTLNMRELGAAESSLADYLGLPVIPTGTGSYGVSAIPFACYAKIYNEYYRDQNLQIDTASNFPNDTLSDGDNSANTQLTILRKRAWQHDYFTSALPWTQKGNEATIPLGTSADINFSPSSQTIVRDQSTGNPFVATDFGMTSTSGGLLETGSPATSLAFDNSANLTADLSTATAASINDLRRAFKLQEWLEKNARGGTRYIESIKSHFGVTSDDARLQRPEFLGGGTTPVQISEVLQTSVATTEPTPLGTQGGHGIAVGQNANVNYYCKEHGYIIGVQTIMPKSAYMQGIPKHLLKWDKLDYYWPSFAHLGEQPVMNMELYSDYDDQLDSATFGYTPRYAEYKFINSSVHGKFKSDLDFWHIARKFSTRPSLNSDFIEMKDSEVDRIFAVQQAEQIYVYLHNKVNARRLMPIFGTPTI